MQPMKTLTRPLFIGLPEPTKKAILDMTRRSEFNAAKFMRDIQEARARRARRSRNPQ